LLLLSCGYTDEERAAFADALSAAELGVSMVQSEVLGGNTTLNNVATGDPIVHLGTGVTLDISEGGVIHIDASGHNSGLIDRGSMVLTPTSRLPTLKWECVLEGIPDEYAPMQCGVL